MRVVVILFLYATIQVGSANCKEPDPELAVFDKMFENMDVSTIIRNHRLVDTYLNCFLNSGNCTHLGSEAKALIPEIIRTNCGRCGDNQKKALRNGLRLFVALRPTDWEKFLDVYDPERKEWPHLKAFIDDEKVNNEYEN